MPAYECRQCGPACSLETCDADIRPPERCPWNGDIEAVWEECE